MNRTNSSTLCLVMCFAAIGALRTTPARAAEPYLLEADPPCIQERLGRVQVELGDARPDPRRGGAVAGVSYARALAKLRAAAAERGADAVVLREHQADYFSKGSRRPSRPTYVKLSGAALRLKAGATGCIFAKIDPIEFERSALDNERADVSRNAGVSF